MTRLTHLFSSLALLGAALPATAGFTQIDVFWSTNLTYAMPFVDNDESTLARGDLVQVGYFPGVDLNKDPADFTAADWAAFTPLTGNGSPNPEIFNTVIGFENAAALPGFLNFSVAFDTDIHDGIPNSDVRVGLRIYDAPTVAGASHFNIVSSSDSTWILNAPSVQVPPPRPAEAELDVGHAAGTLSWLGTPFKTDLMAGSSSGALKLASVTLDHATSLRVTWTGGDGTNTIQTSETGEENSWSDAAADVSSPATITIDPAANPKLLVRVIEP